MGLGGNKYFNAYANQSYKRYSQGSASSQSLCSSTTTINADSSTTTTITCKNGTITKTEYVDGSFTTIVSTPNGVTTIVSTPTNDGSGTSTITITFPNGDTYVTGPG